MADGFRAGFSIRTKLMFVTAAALAGMLAVAIFALSFQKSTLLEDRKIKTRHVVETAYGVLAHFHTLQAKGQLNEEQAKQAALAAVKTLRYETNEYFWVNDLQPRIVMHPMKPELDGKDAGGMKDPNGKALFVEFVNVARSQGGGFVDYLWPKPGADALDSVRFGAASQVLAGPDVEPPDRGGDEGRPRFGVCAYPLV